MNKTTQNKKKNYSQASRDSDNNSKTSKNESVKSGKKNETISFEQFGIMKKE